MAPAIINAHSHRDAKIPVTRKAHPSKAIPWLFRMAVKLAEVDTVHCATGRIVVHLGRREGISRPSITKRASFADGLNKPEISMPRLVGSPGSGQCT